MSLYSDIRAFGAALDCYASTYEAARIKKRIRLQVTPAELEPMIALATFFDVRYVGMEPTIYGFHFDVIPDHPTEIFDEKSG